MTPLPLLDVTGLRTYFPGKFGPIRAVDDVTFSLVRGQAIGIVGESGSGKSVACRSIVGLVPSPGRIVSGVIRFEGTDLAACGPAELRRIRGGRIGYVFQDATAALNPIMSIGDQLIENICAHSNVPRAAANERAVGLLDMVGIPSSRTRVRAYPFELSGGMQQRAMIAIAIACEPALLIADEPTTNLDVTVQAQILDLLKRLQTELDMAIILVSHDLGVVAELCATVAVMYAGRIVERARMSTIYDGAAHPYTRGLLASARSASMLRDTRRLDIGSSRHAVSGRPQLHAIPGNPPDLSVPVVGCAYAARCPVRLEMCWRQRPQLAERREGHSVACWATADRAARVD